MENTAIDSININGANLNSDGTITLTADNGTTCYSSSSSITIDPSAFSNSLTYAGTLTNLGNGIVCNTATGNYYSTTASCSFDPWDIAEGPETLGDVVKKRLEDLIEDEDEMMPLIKNYLRKYLEKVMDNPDEIIKRDEEIKKQKEEIKDLKEQIKSLKEEIRVLQSYKPFGLGDYDYPSTNIPGITVTTADSSWYYDSNAITSSSSFTEVYKNSCQNTTSTIG